MAGMLSAEQMIELEIMARDEVVRLEEEVAKARESTGAVAPDVAIGRISRLDSIQIQEMAKEAQRRRKLRLRMLREALERMDAGEYGFCAECGSPIGFERLKSAPEAPLCGTCAS